MEIALVIFTWIFSIALGLSILSVPLSLVLEKSVKDWTDSKGERIYRYVQYGVFVLSLVTFVVALGLMFG